MVYLQLPSQRDVNEGLCSRIVFDCDAGLVAIRTETYSIQFYSLFDDREISQVGMFLNELLFGHYSSLY